VNAADLKINHRTVFPFFDSLRKNTVTKASINIASWIEFLHSQNKDFVGSTWIFKFVTFVV